MYACNLTLLRTTSCWTNGLWVQWDIHLAGCMWFMVDILSCGFLVQLTVIHNKQREMLVILFGPGLLLHADLSLFSWCLLSKKTNKFTLCSDFIIVFLVITTFAPSALIKPAPSAKFSFCGLFLFSVCLSCLLRELPLGLYPLMLVDPHAYFGPLLARFGNSNKSHFDLIMFLHN